MGDSVKTKPDFEGAMRRVDAWFDGVVLDRVPVRFSKHNAQYEVDSQLDMARWPTLHNRWMDAEYQVEAALKRIAKW